MWGVSRLTRGGMTELFSRDQALGRERGQGENHFLCSADHEQDWQPYRLIPNPLYVMTMYIHTYIRFSLGMENEWADAGRDGRTCLTTPNSQARTGIGENWRPYPVDPHVLYLVCDDKTHIHTYLLETTHNNSSCHLDWPRRLHLRRNCDKSLLSCVPRAG